MKNIFGVVISADAEPNDKYDHSIHPGISLQTVISRLQDSDYSSPQRFWQECKDRIWMAGLNSYIEGYQSINVGCVTYELPTLEKPNDN
ncbi:hypothetical protein Pan161_27670 [Gimesia algae]|uniref:Uncharacterized protein n=1 Tax=Gimesia algae TaxID=2527971 RepID=A0A517VDN8_9PLAN|nr:hypothetical protein Pan161_27670 [Gimesia algae]